MHTKKTIDSRITRNGKKFNAMKKMIVNEKREEKRGENGIKSVVKEFWGKCEIKMIVTQTTEQPKKLRKCEEK